MNCVNCDTPTFITASNRFGWNLYRCKNCGTKWEENEYSGQIITYDTSKQRKKPNKDKCSWSINTTSECQTTCKENHPNDYKECKRFFSLP